MKLEVVVAGSAALPYLGEGLQGSVHSVFERAVNLLVAPPSCDAPVHLTLLTADKHPMALTCPALRDAPRPAPGSPLSFEGGCLRMGALHLDTREAEVWRQPEQLRLAPGAAEGSIARLETRLDAVLDGEAPWRMAREILDRCPAVAFGQAEACFGRLVGYGPGLTPLGDDFISGWLVFHALTAANPARRRECRRLSQALAAGDTTFFSKSQLAFAGQGYCLGSIFELMRAACEDRQPDAPLTQVLGIGATSGWGWAAGLLSALRGLGAKGTGAEICG